MFAFLRMRIEDIESRVVAERDNETCWGLKDDMTMTGERDGSAMESVKGIDMRRPMNAETAKQLASS